MCAAPMIPDTYNKMFESGYVNAYDKLNNAKYYLGNRLSIDSLEPKHKGRCIFWKRLPKNIQEQVRILRDYSVCSSSGLVDLLYNCAYEYQTTTFVDKSGINKYHICDLTHKNNISIPSSTEDWAAMFSFIQSVIFSKQLSAIRLYRSKRMSTKLYQISSDSNQQALEKAMYENDQEILGSLAACLVWMLETKQMNRTYVSQNSVVGTVVYNKGTLLCRKKPADEPEPQVNESPSASSEDEENITKDVVPDNWEDDVPDSWEDL